MKNFILFWVAILVIIFSFGMAFAEEDFPPPRDNTGVIGNSRNNNAWRIGMFQALEMNGVRWSYNVETVTATNVITAAECGTTFFLNSATEFVNTLPAISTVSAGCEFNFIINAAPASASYTVITGNSLENVIFGLAVVNGASVAGASEDTITFTDGAAVKGDWVNIKSDGTAYYVSGQAVAATGITLTAAD